MTHVSTIQSEPTLRAPDRPTPTRDTEQRFEDALARNAGDDMEGDTSVARQDDAPGEPAANALLQPHPDTGRDQGDQRRPSRGLGEIPGLETGMAVAPPVVDGGDSGTSAVTAQSGPTTLPTSYAEMALRMALPQGFHGAETSLMITDPRSIASHSILSHDPTGTLSLDIGAQHGGSSEQQRQELKARLEARGHRVASVEVRPLVPANAACLGETVVNT